jgi:hypothetical protein
MVELRQGDEAPHGEAIKLRGFWHIDHAARVGVPDGKLARLEVWIPVTAPDWHSEQPVSWIVRDGNLGMGTSGLATRAGKLLAGELTSDVVKAFEREHIPLSGHLQLLDVPATPPDPLRMPALVVLIIGGAIALGLLLGGAVVGARYRREAAILQLRRP